MVDVLYYSSIKTKIHVTCYKKLTFGQESVKTKKNGRPKYYHYRGGCILSTEKYMSPNYQPSTVNNKQTQYQSFITQQKIYRKTYNDCWSLSNNEVKKSSIFFHHKCFLCCNYKMMLSRKIN